jgi:hypothetical protein
MAVARTELPAIRSKRLSGGKTDIDRTDLRGVASTRRNVQHTQPGSHAGIIQQSRDGLRGDARQMVVIVRDEAGILPARSLEIGKSFKRDIH